MGGLQDYIVSCSCRQSSVSGTRANPPRIVRVLLAFRHWSGCVIDSYAMKELSQ